MWRRWGLMRQGKLQVLRFIRLRGTPDDVAKGVALGIFIGMTPTFGLQMPLALMAAILLRENKLAAVLGVWITNPLTAPFIYAFEYELGRLILGLPRITFDFEFSFEALTRLGWEILLPLCLGSLVVGILTAVITYAVTLRLIPTIRQLRLARWPRRQRPE